MLSTREIANAKVIIDAEADIRIFLDYVVWLIQKLGLLQLNMEEKNYEMLSKNSKGFNMDTTKRGLWNKTAFENARQRNGVLWGGGI